jgi:hypothetical protein
MASETFAQPLPPMDSEFRRVVITVGTGIGGIVLFVAGAILAVWSYAVAGFNLSDWKFWVGYPAMIASLGWFAWLMQWNRDLDHVSPAIRRTLYGYNIFLGTVFLGAILVLVNVFVAQYGYLFGIKGTYDWTSQGVFTLSPVTKQQIESLQKPVKFTALYQRGTRYQIQLEQLFQLYAQVSKQVSFEFIDPFEDRIVTDDLFKKYPGAQTREPTVIVTYGEGNPPPHKVIKNSDINKVDLKEIDIMAQRGGGDTAFHGENAITSAIRSLIEDKKTNIYFTTGHGEKDLSISDTRELDGIGLLKQRFTELNIKAEPLNLLKGEVPSDANVLVIAGPKRALHPDELAKVRDFMERRDATNEHTSRLIVLLDAPPELRRGEPHDTGLGEFLAAYQVAVKDNVVYDRASAIRRIDQIVVAIGSDTAMHPIVEPLKNDVVVMFQAREIAPIPSATPPGAPPQPNKMEASKLFSTSESPLSWGESEYGEAPSPSGPKDSPGPVCVAVAVSEQEQAAPSPHSFGGPPPPSKSSPRLVVFGDATFISNPLLAQFTQNEDLFLNAVNWLGGRVTDIGIQPRVKKYLRLSLDSAGYYTMILEPMFHVLAIAGFMAGLVWVVRTERFQLLWLPISGSVVAILVYALLLRLFAGAMTTPLKISIMRMALTCVILWTVGFAFQLLQPRRSSRAAQA